jgi:hypothetical protein
MMTAAGAIRRQPALHVHLVGHALKPALSTIFSIHLTLRPLSQQDPAFAIERTRANIPVATGSGARETLIMSVIADLVACAIATYARSRFF